MLMPPPSQPTRVLGVTVSPLTARRFRNFRANRRGWWSTWIFVGLFVFTLFAELVANDKPLVVWYEGDLYTPVFERYPETAFGGQFPTEADYRDPWLARQIADGGGWMIWPLIAYDYQTVSWDMTEPAPAPPSAEHWLGTDDQARDVLARLIYGFRISVLFGLTLTLFSAIIGITVGATQGFYGGALDLFGQRFVEIWTSLPALYILIILAAIVQPNFWILLFFLLLFSWPALVGLVRAEFLRARNFDYVRAARALGVSDRVIIVRHLLPNAMVATITFLPFITVASITGLTGLDYLGFGLPPGSPSLGELIAQGKANLQAPWLGITAFLTLTLMLSLLVFIGEAVRDAFDPRKSVV